MEKDWLDELNELDAVYEYKRIQRKLIRIHVIGGYRYTREETFDSAKSRLHKLRKLAGRDVADMKEWLQKNLTEAQRIQLLWILQEGSHDPIEKIMQYEVTEISTICQKEFGISPKGDM